jgi:hypothetical protein
MIARLRMRSRKTFVAAAFVAITTSSYFAYAQIGGASGVRIPYEGTIDKDGVPITGEVDLTFAVFGVAVDGSACWTSAAMPTTLSSGRFAVVLGPVTDACVADDVYLQITIDDGSGAVTLPGRQRVYPAVASLGSGPGDFHVTGDLVVSGDVVTDGGVKVGGLLDIGFYRKVCYNPAGTGFDDCACNDPTNEIVVTGGADCYGGGAATTAIQFSHPYNAYTWYAQCVNVANNAGTEPNFIEIACARIKD